VYEAVAEVFTLEEDEEGENDGEKGGGEGFDNAPELVETTGGTPDFTDLEGMLRRGANWLFLNFFRRLKGGRGGGIDDAELVREFFQFILDTTDGGVAGAMESFEFCGDVVAVDGEIVGDGDELGEDGPGRDEEERGESEDDDEGCGGTRETEAFKLTDDGSEKECEKDGDPEREEKNLGEIQDSDGKYGDGEEPKLRQQACGW